jgi:hypothetical protein
MEGLLLPELQAASTTSRNSSPTRPDVHTLREVRAVGDASPGGDKTTRDELTLAWPAGPTSWSFPVRLRAFTRTSCSRSPPTASRGCSPRTTRRSPSSSTTRRRLRSISLELDEIEHEGDETTEVEIEIDLRRLVDAVAWEAVVREDGVLRVDASSDQIAAVRERLPQAFDVDD